jgi:hypothetical protein
MTGWDGIDRKIYATSLFDNTLYNIASSMMTPLMLFFLNLMLDISFPVFMAVLRSVKIDYLRVI